MTYEEMDRATGQVKDNLLLQGQPLDRLDRRTTEIAEKIDALRVIAESHEDRAQALEESSKRREGAMTALFERMDRFIRGLESNGHGRSGEA